MAFPDLGQYDDMNGEDSKQLEVKKNQIVVKARRGKDEIISREIKERTTM